MFNHHFYHVSTMFPPWSEDQSPSHRNVPTVHRACGARLGSPFRLRRGGDPFFRYATRPGTRPTGWATSGRRQRRFQTGEVLREKHGKATQETMVLTILPPFSGVSWKCSIRIQFEEGWSIEVALQGFVQYLGTQISSTWTWNCWTIWAPITKMFTWILSHFQINEPTFR